MHASFCVHEIAYMMTQISRMRMYFAKGARPEDPGTHRTLSALAERERVRLHARIQKLDFELSVDDGRWMPDQLIEALF